jgi:predicted PurR-regulated permease PerM
MATAAPLSDGSVTRNAIVTLAVTAGAAAVYFARPVLVPVVLGLVLAAVLRPVVGFLQRAHVPAPAGAALAVLGAIGLIVGAGIALETPVRQLGATIPQSVAAARAKLGRLAQPLRRLGSGAPAPKPSSSPSSAPSSRSKASPAADASPDASPESTGEPSRDSQAKGSPSSGPEPASTGGKSEGGGASSEGLVGRAVGVTTSLVGEIVEVVLLALFVLAAGDGWGRRLKEAVRSPERAQEIADTAAEMEAVVRRYLVVTLAINVVQAVVIAVALWLLDVPSPLLWGMLTFVAEFIPYLGGMIMIGLLVVTGLATDQGLLRAIVPALVYFGVTTLQNNVVSPVLYGRGLRLNPTAILLAVMVWWAMWGVAGAFLAVPLLACFRIHAARSDRLRPAAVFLEE